MRHFGDEEMQAFLDGDATVDVSRLTDHLRKCPDCRRVCEEYRALYVALTDESHVCGPAQGVMDRPTAARADALVGAWALAAALVVAAAVIRVGGLGQGANRVASAFGQLFTQSFGLLVSLRHPLGGSNYEPDVAAAALVAFLAASGALALDHLLLEPRLKGKTS